METIIKTQSYTENFPSDNCNIKVAIKKKDWNINQSITTGCMRRFACKNF